MNEPLILESEKPTPEAPPTCGNCQLFIAYRDPVTNRIHPSYSGSCGWKPKTPWAMAYRLQGYAQEHDPIVYPSHVFKWTNCKTCQCYQPKK